MEAERPTCFELLISWLCIVVALALMALYGNGGWLASLLPVFVAMRMRRDHDRELFDRLRASGAWQRILLAYYGPLSIVVLIAVLRGKRVDQFPVFVQMMILLFPGFACMAWNDLAAPRRAQGPE